MTVELTEQQRARMIELFPSGIDGETEVHKRIFHFAMRGTEAPESLSLKEIKDISFALVVHYTLRHEKTIKSED